MATVALPRIAVLQKSSHRNEVLEESIPRESCEIKWLSDFPLAECDSFQMWDLLLVEQSSNFSVQSMSIELALQTNILMMKLNWGIKKKRKS